MRADATHRYEFEVRGGRHDTFECLARTLDEAEQVARTAGAPVRLIEKVPLGVDDGDAEMRTALLDNGLLREPWRDDLIEIARMLDHVRFTSEMVSVVPAAYLSPATMAARGLQDCDCPKHARRSLSSGMVPVKVTTVVIVKMVGDGGWEVHLQQSDEDASEVARLGEEGWERCAGAECGGALSVWLRPATSVWLVAQHVAFALMVAGDLHPGELSCAAHSPSGPVRR